MTNQNVQHGMIISAAHDQHSEDSPYTTGDIGSFILGVRNDANAVLTSTDGNYSPVSVTSTGALNVAVSNFPNSVEVSNDIGNPLIVAVSGSVAVTQGTNPWIVGDGGGSITVDGTITANQGTNPWTVSGTVAALQSGTWTVNQGTNPWAISGPVTNNYDRAEDSGHTSGDIGAFVLAVRNDAHAVMTSNNLDYGSLSIDSTGALNIADNGGSITVDGTVTADTELAAASVLADADPNPTTSRIGSNALVFNGTTWDRTREPISDAMTVTGLQAAPSMSWNGTGWDRTKTVTNSDGATVTGLQASGPLVFDGSGWNRHRSPTADGNAITGYPGNANLVFNGTTWDRLWEPTSDGMSSSGLGLAAAGNMVYNSTGSFWERMRRASADGLSGTGILASGNMVWNGLSWDRVKEPNADGITVVGLPSSAGMVYDSGAGTWSRLRQGTSQGSVLASAEKNEDSAHTSGQTGTFVLGVRNDAGAAMTDANLDYSPLTTDSTGAVRITGTVTTGAGTARDDTDNQATVTTGAGLQVVRSYVFDGTDWDRQRSVVSLVDGTAGTGLVGQHPYVFNGTTWDRLREPTADTMSALGLASSAGQVFNGSNWDRIRSGGVTGMQGVAGAEAHDAPVTGNPVLIGVRGSTAAPGATSADGDVARLWGTRQGTLRAYPSRRRRSGIYHLSLGSSTVTAAADAATGGRWWLQVPVGATTYAAVRKVFFSSSTVTALATPTSPIFTVERFTFTGTASGAALTPAKRENGDVTATAILRTASTGMTITAGAAAHGFQVPAALATTTQSAQAQVWPQGQDEDEWIILQGGEGIVIRQATAGTTSDTRVVNMDITWEEFLNTDYQIRD